MKKYYCDRCSKEISEKDVSAVGVTKYGVSFTGDDIRHLCPNCREDFFGWIGGHCTCEKKTEEQPKPAKPEKLKPNYYSIAELSEHFGVSRRRMNAIVNRLHLSRQMKKEGKNWWYVYPIASTAEKKIKAEIKKGASK
jgi:hypothetical protein